MAEIYDLNTGRTIAAGLQGCTVCDQAIQVAQEIADARGKSVWLEDDDGEWIVHPMRDGVREPAEPYDENYEDEDDR